jgi:hypothetical protein
VTEPEDTPHMPDGPTPAREQLPLPRRQRQSHLEPHLRTPGGDASGTPFAAFADDGAVDSTTSTSADRADRAAAFHSGARRGRGTTGPRRLGTERHRTDC